MTLQTQGADVLEVALASAFHHRNDMIGVPESFPRARTQAPVEKGLQAAGTAQAFQLLLCVQAIDATKSANSTISFQYFVAQVPRIGAQAPFFHAPFRTKGVAAFRHLQIAPAAKIAAIRAFLEGAAVSPATSHSP